MRVRLRYALETVVVNTTTNESGALLELLRVWSSPAYAPLAPGDRPFRLVVLLNQEPGEALRRAVRAMVGQGELAGAVSKIEFVVLALAPELDRYERHQVGDPGPYGFKSGPNVQFFRGMERLGRHDGSFALIIETDTRPVRAAWVTAAREQAFHHPDAWILGSTYRGPERALAGSIRSHLNGNAIYSLGADFAAFRHTCWEPALQTVVRTHPNVAYDFVLDLVLNTDAAPPLAAAVHAERHRFIATDYIQNLVVWQRYDPDAIAWPAVVSTILRDHPDTHVVHGVRGLKRTPWD